MCFNFNLLLYEYFIDEYGFYRKEEINKRVGRKVSLRNYIYFWGRFYL